MEEFTLELTRAPEWLQCGTYLTTGFVSVWDRHAGSRISNGDFVYVRFSMDSIADKRVTPVRWNVTNGHGRALMPSRPVGIAVGPTKDKKQSRIRLTYGGALVIVAKVYMYGPSIAVDYVLDE